MPEPTYKLIVEVEGERVYYTEAYSSDHLIEHLRDADRAVESKQTELLEEVLA